MGAVGGGVEFEDGSGVGGEEVVAAEIDLRGWLWSAGAGGERVVES